MARDRRFVEKKPTQFGLWVLDQAVPKIEDGETVWVWQNPIEKKWYEQWERETREWDAILEKYDKSLKK